MPRYLDPLGVLLFRAPGTFSPAPNTAPVGFPVVFMREVFRPAASPAAVWLLQAQHGKGSTSWARFALRTALLGNPATLVLSMARTAPRGFQATPWCLTALGTGSE